MAKQPRGKTRAARPDAAPPPAKTLMEFTERGFDALKARLQGPAAGGKPDKKGQAFGEAVERLRADYERLLKRTR
jgi:hypothetical protein